MATLATEELFLTSEAQKALLTRVRTLAAGFSARAAAHDRAASFPHENFAELRAAGLPALCVPEAYGGRGGGVLDMVLAQVEIARGDGATGLCLGWHQGLIGRVAETGAWAAAHYEPLCRDVVARGALINSIASEEATGSPSRGGQPQTVATAMPDGGWRLDGRKLYATGAPTLDYFLVLASLPAGRGWFLVPRATPGLSIEETWDTLGMRASGSHDAVFAGMLLPPEALVERPLTSHGAGFGQGGGGAGWTLHVPATYIGVARAAADFAVAYAGQHAPNSLQGPIIALPHIQATLGEMERELLVALTALYGWARAWDEADAPRRAALVPGVGGVKSHVTNAAIRIVDLAMRVVGATGLWRRHPLERHYRDVRAGLHHPPMDDAALGALARAAAGEAPGPGERQ